MTVASHFNLPTHSVLAAFTPKVATDICLHMRDRKSQVFHDFMEKIKKTSMWVTDHSVTCVCNIPDASLFGLINTVHELIDNLLQYQTEANS